MQFTIDGKPTEIMIVESLKPIPVKIGGCVIKTNEFFGRTAIQFTNESDTPINIESPHWIGQTRIYPGKTLYTELHHQSSEKLVNLIQ